MREVYLEGRLMTDRAAAHAEIKNKLSLPEYYGCLLYTSHPADGR